MFRALGNQNRIKIIEHLKRNALTPTDLTEKLKLSYQATYNHIRKLDEAGFLQKERSHNYVFYSLDTNANKKIKTLLNLICK